MVCLCNGGVDGNGIGIGNSGVENDRVVVEGGDVGTGDVDIFEGLYLTPFLSSRIVVPARCQAVRHCRSDEQQQVRRLAVQLTDERREQWALLEQVLPTMEASAEAAA